MLIPNLPSDDTLLKEKRIFQKCGKQTKVHGCPIKQSAQLNNHIRAAYAQTAVTACTKGRIITQWGSIFAGRMFVGDEGGGD
jgi:hypothetical protein